jgi:ribosomal protein L7/L12
VKERIMPKCRFCEQNNPAGVDRCQHCGAWLEQKEQPLPAPILEAQAMSAADFESQVRSLASRGQMIGAIKLYRARTGMGLAEAKRAVEAIAAGQPFEEKNAVADGASGDMSGSTGDQVLALLRAGKKIEAIKHFRLQTGVGLKEAKDAVEALAVKHGINTKGAGCAGAVLMAIALASSLTIACGLVAGIVGCGQDRNAQPPAKTETHVEPAEPWMTSGKSWPQLVLTNEATFRGHSPLHGASAFLVSTQDGRTFAATAKHLIGENGGVVPEVSLDELNSVLQQWRMFPRTRPKESVEIEGLGLHGLESKRCDWLVLKLKQAGAKLPADPLHIRRDPVTIGERVYLLGCPYAEEGCTQNVYRGTVTARVNDRFRYDLDPPVELRGFSGAPIIDEKGLVVGVMTVWFKPNVRGETYLEGGGEDASTIYSLIEKQ